MASTIELLNARAVLSVKKGRGRTIAKVTVKKKSAPNKEIGPIQRNR